MRVSIYIYFHMTLSGDALLALLALLTLLTLDVVDLRLPFLDLLGDLPGFTILPLDFFEVRFRLPADDTSVRIIDPSPCVDLTDFEDLRDRLDSIDLVDLVDITDPRRLVELGTLYGSLSVMLRFGKYFPIGFHPDCARAEKSMCASGLGYVYSSSGRLSNGLACTESLSFSSDEEMLGLDSTLKKYKHTVYLISSSQCRLIK